MKSILASLSNAHRDGICNQRRAHESLCWNVTASSETNRSTTISSWMKRNILTSGNRLLMDKDPLLGMCWWFPQCSTGREIRWNIFLHFGHLWWNLRLAIDCSDLQVIPRDSVVSGFPWLHLLLLRKWMSARAYCKLHSSCSESLNVRLLLQL